MTKLQVSTEVPNEIHMTRVFDAPRRLVMQAMTTPELVMKWLGNSHSPITSAEIDLRVGGKYRYVFRRPDGVEFALGGVHREIGDDRIVMTQAMEGMPGESVVTTTWTEHAGKTTMKVVIRFESQAMRDMVVATGMATGAGESYDNLERLVTSL